MWTYEVTTGKMYSPDGGIAGIGYSGGNLGRNPEAINNPMAEAMPNIGPLPEGLYTLGQMIMHHPKLGAFAIQLIPDPGNKMLGRSGFYIHGDTTPPGNASEGCIIQALDTRTAMWNSTDHQLQVVSEMVPQMKIDPEMLT